MEKIFLSSASNESDSLPFKIILSGITYPDPDYSIYRKCSDVYVAEYVTEGEGTVILGGKIYRIKKGDAYILPAGTEHRYYSDKNNPWEKKWINMSGSICKLLLEAYGIEKTVCFHNSEIEKNFDEFFEFCSKGHLDNEINNFGAVIFHRIVQKLAENTEKKEKNPAEKIKKYIDGNIYDKINAKSVARASGFSVSQIGRLFKNEYGTTVYSYILEQKIKAAEKLIKNSSLSIKETASILNFTDEHYFCNIFKRKRGMTPGEFRKSSGLLLAEY